mgnify:CR=1 FL=1
MFKVFVVLGSLNALLTVAFGAFGAHGLKGSIPPHLFETYETGVQYQMFHSLGMLLVAALSAALGDGRLLRWSGGLMQAGIVLFSGSLYVLSMTGITWLGTITPFGGVSFLAAWFLLGMAAWKKAGKP